MKCRWPDDKYPITVICGCKAKAIVTLNATPLQDWPERKTQVWLPVFLCEVHAEMLIRIRNGE